MCNQMTSDLSQNCIHQDSSIRVAMTCIEHSHAKVALVVDSQYRLMDTITDGDVRRAILGGEDLDAPVSSLRIRKSNSPHSQPVTSPVDTERSALLRLMQERDVRHVPLLDEEDRVVGLVTLSDLLPSEELPLRGVIMAGGRGSRLHPLTEDLPKPMLRVGDRPLLESIIEQLREASIQQVNLITHYKKEIIAGHFGDGQHFGVDIRYVEEDQPLGTAGGLGLLEETDKPLLVINGDILTKVDFRAMLEFHCEQKADMTVAVRSYEFHLQYGVVETEGAVITGITEKPVLRHFINAGIYLLNPQLCQYLPAGQKYDMPDLIQLVLSDGKRVVSFPVHEYWLDIGQAEDYQRAQADSAGGTY